MNNLICAQCGATFSKARLGPPKRFCGRDCRETYWLERGEAQRKQRYVPGAFEDIGAGLCACGVERRLYQPLPSGVAACSVCVVRRIARAA